MYVPAWQGLRPGHVLSRAGATPLPFPLNAVHQTSAYVARNVIFHLFRALQLQRDEIVLVPDYHSGVEVWAIRAAGAAVRFYPIRRSLEPDLDALARLCTPKVRALYVIHFLGWPQPMAALTALCRERGITLIEDCALSLLSESAGQPLGTFGDYAVFCLYKTLPVPHGGLLVQNRHPLPEITRLEMVPPPLASVAGRSAELLAEWIRGRADPAGTALAWLKRGTGRALTRVGIGRLAVGDISPQFSSPGFDLARVNVGMSPLCRRILRSLDYETIRQRRRLNFLRLRDRLAGRLPAVREDLPDGAVPLFFPVLVADKPRAARALRARGISAVEFWNYGHPEADGQTSQDARELRAHVLELPIHQDVTAAQIDYMADQVEALAIQPWERRAGVLTQA